MRHYSLSDQIITQIDNCLTALGSDKPARRPYPADNVQESELNTTQKKQSAGFMRVNHSGEVCAQALYNAQALVARDDAIRKTLSACGDEETDHLAWCNQRLNELDSHRSYLNIFWYWKSFTIGIAAGIAGDKWSLGFVEETEIQVGNHLQSHLDKITNQDNKSTSVISQMQIDEARHADTANKEGAHPLPTPIKKLMSLHAKVMTTLAYWI